VVLVELAESVGLVESVVPVVLVELAESVGLVESVELGVQVESAVLGELAAIVHRLCLLEETAAIGSTIHNIVVARHTETVQRQTGLAAQRAETPWRTAKLALVSNLADRVEISPATVLGAAA